MYRSLAEPMTLVHPILPITVQKDAQGCHGLDERMRLQLPCCARPLLPPLFILDIVIDAIEQSATHTEATLEICLEVGRPLAVDTKGLCGAEPQQSVSACFPSSQYGVQGGAEMCAFPPVDGAARHAENFEADAGRGPTQPPHPHRPTRRRPARPFLYHVTAVTSKSSTTAGTRNAKKSDREMKNVCTCTVLRKPEGEPLENTTLGAAGLVRRAVLQASVTSRTAHVLTRTPTCSKCTLAASSKDANTTCKSSQRCRRRRGQAASSDVVWRGWKRE